MTASFFNLYHHNFIRLALAIPRVHVADPARNADHIIALMNQAAEKRAALVAFPELSLAAYTCEDLIQQRAVLTACEQGLTHVLRETARLPLTAVIGLPVQVDDLLYNCAAVIHGGRILGIVPKTYLANYREYYEMRHFASGDCATRTAIALAGQADTPFGTKLIFQAADQPLLRVHVEICEDLWVPIPPSSYAALAGATVIVNPSASNITVGKADYRRQLVANQSGRCLAAYAYCAAGAGESTTDLAWDGHGMIYENGSRLAESERFCEQPQLITADVDLDRLNMDRMRQTSFAQSGQRHREHLADFRTVVFDAHLPKQGTLPLQRLYERFPYVPSHLARRDERCNEVYRIQVQGLVQRLRATGLQRLVIGVSGGLDSTQALLVCARALDTLSLPRTNILAYTLPGYATGKRTLDQSRRLMEAIGATARQIDIRAACDQMFKDIGHPYVQGKPVYDITFENVQAGARTSLLFRLANQEGGMVVGTSDLSELALGWATYGVGDHMAHYHVNASVPKTLLQFLLRWAADTHQLGENVSAVVRDVLETDISPELIPGEDADGRPAQRTEDCIGPYALQDFNLYYILRYGYDPAKVAFLAHSAWSDADRGAWPDVPGHQRRAYDIAEIKCWLRVFLKRFFETSQFKRSAMPNAPKVGSGGSLSPRGDWRAPSDASAAAWLERLESVPERE